MHKSFLILFLLSSFCCAEAESFIQPKKEKRQKAIYLKQDIAQLFKELHNILTDMVRLVGRIAMHKNISVQKIATKLHEHHQALSADFHKELVRAPTKKLNLLVELANFLELIVDKTDELLEGNKNTFLGSAKRKGLQPYVVSLREMRDAVHVQAARLRTITA